MSTITASRRSATSRRGWRNLLHRHGQLAASAAAFATIALPISTLGVVWPRARLELGQSAAALGVVTATYALARLSSSMSGAITTRRLGAERGLAGGLALLMVTCGALAAATSWSAFLVAVAAVGAASGWLDSTVAAVLARRGRVEDASLVHGIHGIGATVAPLVASALVGWRGALVGIAGVALAAAAFALLATTGAARDASHGPVARARARHPAGRAGRWDGRRAPPPLLATVVSLVLVGVVAGAEVTVGQWSYTWLVEARGVGAGRAGVAVGAFWGGSTLGRMLLARFGGSHVLARVGLARIALAGGLGLAGLVAWPSLPGSTAVVALAVVGFVSAPTIPTLMATTARRVGADQAIRVAGWQVLALGVGATTMPALAGLLVDRGGPGPLLLPALLLASVAAPVLMVAERLPDRSR